MAVCVRVSRLEQRPQTLELVATLLAAESDSVSGGIVCGQQGARLREPPLRTELPHPPPQHEIAEDEVL
jgi:hypothetical protein